MVKYKNSILIFFAIVLLTLHFIKHFYFNEKVSTLLLGSTAIVLLLIHLFRKKVWK